MESIDSVEDMSPDAAARDRDAEWVRVVRDVLVFQFKLVVDGLKDLCLAQVAVGAALLDAIRRDGTPGRRFYAIVRLSDRFDTWLDLHEPLARLPGDAPDYAPRAQHSVDDIIDGLENTARVVAEASVSASTRGLRTVKRQAEQRRRVREAHAAGGMAQAFGRR